MLVFRAAVAGTVLALAVEAISPLSAAVFANCSGLQSGPLGVRLRERLSERWRYFRFGVASVVLAGLAYGVLLRSVACTLTMSGCLLVYAVWVGVQEIFAFNGRNKIQ
jgi:hypothetical protein